MNAKCRMFAWTLWRVPLGRQNYENICLFNPKRYSSLRLWPNSVFCKHCSFNATKHIPSSFAELCATHKQKSSCHLFAVRYSSSRLVDSRERKYTKGATNGLNQFQSSEMKRLLSLAEPEKWQLTGAIALLLVSSGVSMSVPFALGKVIDLIYTADSVKMHENINMLCVTLLGIFIVGAACNFGRVYLMNLSGQRITRALREKVFGAIVSQEVAFFDQNKTGELVNRLSSDTSLVSQCITINISDGLRSLLMVCVGVSMMFYMSVELTLVSLAIVPPIAATAIIYGRFVRKISKDVQDALADASQVAEERIGNIRTVKSFSQEPREVNAYKKKMQLVLDLVAKSSLAQGVFFGMTGLCGNGIVLSVLYYGGVMVSDSTITVGHLAAFLLYAAYIGVSLGGLSSFYSQMAQGLGASTRLWELIDRQPAIPVSVTLFCRDFLAFLISSCEKEVDNIRYNYNIFKQ